MPNIHDWDADHPAVWVERVGDEQLSVRHPSYPANLLWIDGDDEELKRRVADYLRRVGPKLGLSDLFEPKSSQFRKEVRLAWLPFTRPSNGEETSIIFQRGSDAGAGPGAPPVWCDRSVVLLVVETLEANDPDQALRSRYGIHVTAHLSRPVSEQGGVARRTGMARRHELLVRITGAARTLGLPESVPRRTAAEMEAVSAAFGPGAAGVAGTLSASAQARILQGAGLDDHVLIPDGLRVLAGSIEALRLQLFFNALPRNAQGTDTFAYSLVATVALTRESRPGTAIVESLERFPLVAHAARHPTISSSLFARDPAGKAGPGRLGDARPNRASDRLSRFVDLAELVDLQTDGAGKPVLADQQRLVRVTRSALVDGGADEGAPQQLGPATSPAPRTNRFAARSAYANARGKLDASGRRPLFDTIKAFGLPPAKYFAFADAPLDIQYRGRITPGPGRDGRTVNAQVNFYPDVERRLQLRFALGDLKRSTSRRDPLGLAADPRWSWHEYCHVLLAAKTGALELAFVHSAGDALAAIVSDPHSELASDPWMRGSTFPWVHASRRHDRAVRDGWGWCGRRHRQGWFLPNASNTQLKGYDSEQILSTTLFRLYRALGGETDQGDGTPDVGARQRAADYAVYLILRAILLLPPNRWGPIATPDQLVSKLIDADVATYPAASGPLARRVGGWSHKVIRWAFEAQGLYATTDPNRVVDEPGRPPPVDIFIDDRRPDADGASPRGGYMPVSLHARMQAGLPAWHASEDAMRIDGDRLRVKVRNRGEVDARGVFVAVYLIDRPVSEPVPPDWSHWTWRRIGVIGPGHVPPNGGEVAFGPFRLPRQPAGTRRHVLAIADCAGDFANTNPLTLLPCSLVPTPLVDLVAGDNNLGLRVIEPS